MVHGDGHAHLVALLVPEPEFAEKTTAAGGDIHRALAPAVERVNARLSQIERIRRFAVAPSPFDIDNAMLTPSLKIRRHKIREAYGAVLERLYDGGR
jgi:long-chain acyl-CoA synthetase